MTLEELNKKIWEFPSDCWREQALALTGVDLASNDFSNLALRDFHGTHMSCDKIAQICAWWFVAGATAATLKVKH